MKNKGKIIGISIAILIILILGIGAILFFTTDIFKGNDELFYRYLAQNVDELEKILDTSYTDYLKSIQEGKYTTDANFTFDLVSSDSAIADQTIPPRNFSVKYEAKGDTVNNKKYSKTTLKYLTNDIFNVQYIQDDAQYAIKSDEVVNKYLVLKNDNLKQLATKFGITDTTNIPNKIETTNIEQLFLMSQENKDAIFNKYATVISSNIPKNSFSKKQNVEIQFNDKTITTNIYSLTLSYSQSHQIALAFLETLKEDDPTLNLVLEKVKLIDSKTTMSINDLKNEIQKEIDKLNNITTDDENPITISLYEKDKKLVKTQISQNEISPITIDYIESKNAIKVAISFEYNKTQENSTTENETTNTINDGYLNIEDVNGNTSTNNNQTNSNININKSQITSIEFAKQTTDGKTQNIIALGLKNGKNNIKVAYQSILTDDVQNTQVDNNMIVNINVNDTTYFTIKSNSVTKADESVIIEDLTNENSAIVNDFTPQYTSDLLAGIIKRLQQLYSQKMITITTIQQEENTNNQSNATNTTGDTNTVSNNNTITGNTTL